MRGTGTVSEGVHSPPRGAGEDVVLSMGTAAAAAHFVHRRPWGSQSQREGSDPPDDWARIPVLVRSSVQRTEGSETDKGVGIEGYTPLFFLFYNPSFCTGPCLP